MGPCSRSVLITLTVRVTKQHSGNISFLKKTIAAHYRGTIGLVVFETYVPVFYRKLKYSSSSYILFYDKTRIQMFYFLNMECIVSV